MGTKGLEYANLFLFATITSHITNLYPPPCIMLGLYLDPPGNKVSQKLLALRWTF